MKLGRTYEVFVGGNPVGLVGSTTLTLKKRRNTGYIKRFGPTVELRLIREVSRPEGYSDEKYIFYLRRCEEEDITLKKAWVKDGGRNVFSPVKQEFWLPMLRAEIGKIGGRIQGRRNAENGHLSRITELPQTKEGQRKNGSVQGRENVNSGRGLFGQTSEQKLSNSSEGGKITGYRHANNHTGVCGRTAEKMSKDGEKGGKVGGQKNAESGWMKSLGHSGIGLCKRWNLNRGKPCTCGEHHNEL